MSRIMVEQEQSFESKNGFLNFLVSIKEKVTPSKESEKDKLVNMIKEAHNEWQQAESFFQDATEPDLIDYAIYRVEATKTKYRYLIKQAKQSNIKIDL
ncbi:YaaL family protein [Sporosalibacterium faouarense]|uniref:YaaL family protein n=1 Tax=Sporosalibacterium faouarense TaxID=516123 RepID=UPI00141C1BF4|nr:YaaL family protein [Sporosalibacterium faouarense]MTI48796.1 DUF2508 family protein [Bacillota bacterium]